MSKMALSTLSSFLALYHFAPIMETKSHIYIFHEGDMAHIYLYISFYEGEMANERKNK